MVSAARPSGPIRLRPRRRCHARRRLRWRLLVLARLPLVGSVWSMADRRRRLGAAARPTVALVVVSLATAAVGLAGAPPAGGQGAGGHVPPVDAPIVDPFRPPAGPYGAGNRGLEYDTRPGDVVRASADGVVTFAGMVAGARHVTVQHDGDVRTSYSFLDGIGVVTGQRLGQGDRLGTAGERLHFGARSGDAYFDPAALFTGNGPVEVELLPLEIPPGSSPRGEAEYLVALTLAEDGWSVPGAGAAFDWLRDRAGTTAVYFDDLNLAGRGIDAVADVGTRLFFHGPCSDGPPPPRPVAGDDGRVAITVAGLGSSSTSGSIDELRTADLGYDPGRVVRFSYGGGRVPGSGTAFADLDTSTYETEHTQGDVQVAAVRLADLIQQVVAADADATIDVFAHSQGGVVTRLALLELAERGVALDRLGVVTTLGSPHHGADLATAVTAANTSLTGNLGLDAAEGLLRTGIDPDAESLRQMAEHSDVVRQLVRAGVPPGVQLLSIAARGDVVVAAPQSDVAGATNVTVPVMGWSAHSDVVASDAATDEMRRALADQPPACEGWRDVLADVTVGHGISLLEDQAGALAVSGLR